MPVTTQQGKHCLLNTNAPTISQTTFLSEPSWVELIMNYHMKPKHHSYFHLDVPDLDDIILFLLNHDGADLLDDTSWLNLALVNHVYLEISCFANN
jgi:hypothetical protein